mmetsp:Transcript_5151/g.17059  ORF Transcript_5151/g.17059 Transcript_5151/m.17059 type:complete len:320 (-) Transcript_5151:576-1535(-)
MLLARLGHSLGTVALGQHHHRPSGGLECVHVRVHPSGGGGAKGARDHPVWRLCGPGIVDGVIPHVLGETVALVQPLLQLGVGDVASDDEGAGEGEARLDRAGGESGQDGGHRGGEVDADYVGGKGGVSHLWQVLCRVRLEGLQPHTPLVDLAHRLPVSRARHPNAHWTTGAVPRQPHHPNVVTEILAPELRADAQPMRQRQHLSLHVGVSEGAAAGGARGWQGVQVAGGGVFDRLESHLGRQTADDDGQVIGGACRRAERDDLLFQEGHHALRVEQRLGLLVKKRLVGRPAAFGHELEAVGRARDRRDVDLGRQVCLCV